MRATRQSDRLPRRAIAHGGPATKDSYIDTALQVGKYLVSSHARRNDDGHYTASVSIRSGHGSMAHDRVLRFVPVFDTQDRANRFAISQALTWIGARASATASSHLSTITRN